MYLYLFIWITFFNVSFSKEKCPTGTVQIDKNLFVDKTEVSILYYREYLYWLKRIFEEESDIYQKAFPDVSVLVSLTRSLNTNPNEFLMNADFTNYPILGINYRQATNFCQWRSDRVYEMYLVSNNIIEWDTAQTKFNFFTIKKYRDEHPKETSRYPEYRLSSVEEWDMISEHGKVNKRFIRKLKPQQKTTLKKIRNLYGNVAELTSTPGISKGGSYKDDETLITSNWIREYSGPSDWLGFRCICSWKD